MNMERWTSGAHYDQWMGRWSRLLAQVFLKWLDVPAGLRWIDVCCGSGMITEAIVERNAPASVVGVDASTEQIGFARQHRAHPKVSFETADAPVVFALAAIMTLPESIKFMTLHESHRGKMVALLTSIRPDYKVPPNARFVIEDEKQSPSNPIYLLGNGLLAITPLTWLMFACNLMGYFFLISWTPTLMGAAHVPPQMAALAGAALQVGGTVGSLLLCWWLQKARFLAIAILFVIAVPVVGSIGYAGLSSTGALIAVTFFAGFIVLGIQSGINVVGAMIYPTSLRANGSGWQLGIGRFGAIIGPLVGAYFVGLPVPQLYMWSAIPFAVGAVVCFIIYRLNTARIKARPELAQGQ